MWKNSAEWKCQWWFHLKIARKKHQTSDEIARLFVVFVWHTRLIVYISLNVIIVLGRRSKQINDMDKQQSRTSKETIKSNDSKDLTPIIINTIHDQERISFIRFSFYFGNFIIAKFTIN